MKKTLLFLSLCAFGLWSCGSDGSANNNVSQQSPAQEAQQEQEAPKINPDAPQQQEEASAPAPSNNASSTKFDFAGSKVINFTGKTNENAAERTKILDILRASLYQDYKQEFQFVVNHLKIANGYAWFMGDVQRKDGKKVQLKYPDDDIEDCCHYEALLQYKGGKWYLVESAAFATDLWFGDIPDRIPGVPNTIFN